MATNAIDVLAGITGNAKSQINANDELVQLQQKSAQQQEVIDSQKRQADTMAEQNNRNAAATLGLDMDGKAALESKWLAEIRDNTQAALDKSKEVSRLDAISFFDDPLGWLPNQFKADAVEQEVQDHVTTATIAKQGIANMHSLINSGADTREKVKQLNTDATMAATLGLVATKAKQAEAELAGKVAASNINALGAIQSADQHALSMVATRQSMQNDMVRLHMQQQAAADSRETEALQKQSLRLDIAAKEFKVSTQKDAYDLTTQIKEANLEKTRILTDKAQLDKDKKTSAYELQLAKLDLSKKNQELAQERAEAAREILPTKKKLLEDSLAKKEIELKNMQNQYDLKEKDINSKITARETAIKNSESSMTARDAKLQGQLEHLSIINEEAGLKLQEHLGIRQQQAKDAADVKEGLAAMGYTAKAEQVPTDPAQFALWMKSQSKDLLELAKTSSAYKQQGIMETGILGMNPLQTLKTIREKGMPDNLPAKTKDTLTWLVHQEQVFNASKMQQAKPGTEQALEKDRWMKLSEQEKDAEKSYFLQQQYHASTNLADAAGSLHQAPKLAEFMENGTLAKLPGWMKVLNVAAANGDGDSSYSHVYDLLGEAVKQKVITSEQAIDTIATLYQQTKLYNNATKNFPMIGFGTQQYYTAIKKSDGQVFDASDRAQVSRDWLANESKVKFSLFGSTDNIAKRLNMFKEQ